MIMDLASGQNFVKINYQISRYVLQAMRNQVVNRKDNTLKRKNALKITGDNSNRILNKLGVKINVCKNRDDLFDRNYFMVSNHMSYIDILILSSIRPAVFITSVEMEKTFFLGDLAKLGGSFFVDRINRRKMKTEVQSLVNLLGEGFNVFLFPEGTSTNGSEILPFKKSLFRVPFQTEFPILPICLKYRQINGEPFSPENCDRVCWYDEMTFAPHFLQLMGLRDLQVDVHYLEPLWPKDFKDHSELTLAAREQITSVYFNKN